MNYSIETGKQIRAYELTFLIENKLRVSMHNIMVKKEGLLYFNETIFPEYEYKKIADRKKITIVKSAKDRRGTERKYNISLGYDYPYFWYLDYNVLISVIDVFWNQYFHEMFKSPRKIKNDIITRLENIIPVRNAIAHHRYISNIDTADLESLLRVLNNSLDKIYIYNFNEIALNSFETLVKGFLDSCSKIKDMIGKGKFLDRLKLRKLKSSFSAIASGIENERGIDEFEEIFDLLAKYNQLPKKPGRGNEIASFRKQTEIERKISLLMKLIGDRI